MKRDRLKVKDIFLNYNLGGYIIIFFVFNMKNFKIFFIYCDIKKNAVIIFFVYIDIKIEFFC